MARDAQHHQDRAERATADRSAVERIDAQVVALVAPYRDTVPVRAMSAVSEILDQPPLIALSIAVAAGGLATHNPRLARTGLRMLAAHAAATLAKGIVKNRVDRTRPRKMVAEGDYQMEKGESEESDLRSFPSGHTAGGVAVVRAMAREYPQTAAPAGTALGAMAIALMPKQAHYPSDIVAGAAIGWAAEALVDYAWGRLERHLPKAIATR